jgi:hypothetical protein
MGTKHHHKMSWWSYNIQYLSGRKHRLNTYFFIAENHKIYYFLSKRSAIPPYSELSQNRVLWAFEQRLSMDHCQSRNYRHLKRPGHRRSLPRLACKQEHRMRIEIAEHLCWLISRESFPAKYETVLPSIRSSFSPTEPHQSGSADRESDATAVG